MTVDKSKLSFYSQANYLKRDISFVGTTLLTIPAAGSVVSHTITHNFGDVPQVYVGVNADNDGVIWSGQKIHAFTESSLGGLIESDIEQILSSYYVDTTTLVIYLENQTTTAAGGQRRIYWVTYKDYSS